MAEELDVTELVERQVHQKATKLQVSKQNPHKFKKVTHLKKEKSKDFSEFLNLQV